MRVKIYRPSKTSMQSGRSKIDQWILEYEVTSGRIPESLMGWVSSQDTLNQVQIPFESKEKAKEFAEEKGWAYTVLRSHERRLKPRNYGDNFIYRPVEEGS